MSDPLRIESKGVTVTKRYEPEAFAVPTISLEIRSTQELPAEVRLEEPIPESFSPDGIGFHPDFDDDQWSIGDERLVFEGRIDPETTLVTIYGIRIENDEDAKAFMNRPELAVSVMEPDTEGPSDVESDDRLAEELSALRRDIAMIDARIAAAVDRQDRAIDALESELASHRRSPVWAADLTADIEAVSDDLDALYDEVGELQVWREQADVSFGTE